MNFRFIFRLFKKPERMIYIEVLKYLSHKGLYTEADIMPLFKGKSYEDAFKILTPIIEQHHIEYSFKYDKIHISASGGQTPGSIIGLTANLTFSGMDFLIKNSLFERTKNSITNQFWIGIVTIFLLAISTAASAIATYLSYTSNKQSNIELQQLQNLKLEVHKLQDTLSTLNKNAKPHASRAP